MVNKTMIPKIIHTAWCGAKPAPEILNECLKTWLKILPEYDIKIWRTIPENAPKYVIDAFNANKMWLCSDCLRCWLLYKYGGIWMDIDCKVVKPIDDILTNEAFIGIQRDDTIKDCVNPAVCGAVHGHWFFKKCLDMFDARNGADDYGPIGCILLTDYLTSCGLQLSANIQILNGLVVYPREYFFPRTWGDKSAGKDMYTENTRIEHLFAGTWL